MPALLPSTLLLSLFLSCREDAPPPAATAPAVGLQAAHDELEARRQLLQDAVRAMVGELQSAGRYDCCVEAPCTQCAMRVGGCKCGEGLRRGEPVCEECAMMWRLGRGAEPGVDPGSVRSFLEAARDEEAKARGEQQGCSCPDAPPPQ